MPSRLVRFTEGEFYHVFNHSIAGIPIFKGSRETDLFLEAMEFYLQPIPPIKFSIYRTSRKSFPLNLDERIIMLTSYCLMPNHFHFLLRQNKENGIRQYLQRLCNSFAHYFSIKYHRRGHLFEDKFKAVHIETEEQLLHVSRYIHLNPVTAHIVERPEDYPYSSYGIFLGQKSSKIIDPSPVLSSFSSRNKYREFVMSQKDYQRSLNNIKHLVFE